MTTYKLQEEIHKAVKAKLCAGMTEIQLADVITAVCSHWKGDVISGVRTAEIEGPPTDRVIQKGDVVLLDLQVCAGGVWSDLTRVYFVGGMSSTQREAFDKVAGAIHIGEKMLKPGLVVSELWHSMRNAIDSEFAFNHHAGHRIGVTNIVAEPRFVPECGDALCKGMTVTLEPAIYFPGKFGIRLENNYLITSDGARCLCSLSMKPDDFIVKG